MTDERRQARRYTRPQKGRILPSGGLPIPCTIIDFSTDGAQIAIDDPEAVPSQFMLAFEEGFTRKRCQVKWKKPGAVGVEFLWQD